MILSLHTYLLWAVRLVDKALDILMEIMCQSAPSIHVALAQVLLWDPWLLQASGMPYEPEKPLVWCGPWSHYLWEGEHQLSHFHRCRFLLWIHQMSSLLSWPGPSQDTHHVLLSQRCILLCQGVCISKVGEVMSWVRSLHSTFSPHLAHTVIFNQDMCFNHCLWHQDKRLLDGVEAFATSHQCDTAAISFIPGSWKTGL